MDKASRRRETRRKMKIPSHQ
jgi:hypothetical protein